MISIIFSLVKKEGALKPVLNSSIGSQSGMGQEYYKHIMKRLIQYFHLLVVEVMV